MSDKNEQNQGATQDDQPRPDAPQSEEQTTQAKESAPGIRDTEMLSMPADFEPKPMPERAPTANTTRLTAGWRIVFRIGDQKKTLNILDKMVVGRGVENDVGSDIDFDLTPYGAYHFGVSRKHAVMTLKDGYLYLEDLGSTNGTRINGFQLTANQKYRLRDGDEIEFARLRVNIRFRNPEQD